MKLLASLVIAVFAVVAADEEKYSTKWDNINVDEILQSERLLNNYFKCLMEKGPCTPEGSELKRVLPDSLKTECSKCSEKQKENTDKVVHFLIEKRQDLWKDLQSKYDPEGTYYRLYYTKKHTN